MLKALNPKISSIMCDTLARPIDCKAKNQEDVRFAHWADFCFAICRVILGTVHHLEPPRAQAQSPFLFPIGFGNNLVPFFIERWTEQPCIRSFTSYYYYYYFFKFETTLLTKHNSESGYKQTKSRRRKRRVYTEEKWEQKKEEKMRAEEGREMGA